jgi:hypothetical protein
MNAFYKIAFPVLVLLPVLFLSGRAGTPIPAVHGILPILKGDLNARGAAW